MPITTTGSPTIEYANVKLLHMTRNNSVEDPITVAFAVTDETGTEQVINVQCPTAGSLFQLLSEAGWVGPPKHAYRAAVCPPAAQPHPSASRSPPLCRAGMPRGHTRGNPTHAF